MSSYTNSKKLVMIGSGVSARGALQVIKDQQQKHNYSITVIRNHPAQVVPCAIPYIFKRLKPTNIEIPDNNWSKVNAEIINDKVDSIDRENSKVILNNGETVMYDKLLIATGADPVKPPIKGNEKKNVYFVEKNMELLQELQEKIFQSRSIAIIGGSFIGVELADELSLLEHLDSIHLVEAENNLLPKAFDEDISSELENILKEKINIYTEEIVKEIKGDEAVESVELSSSGEIDCDLVICAIGVSPNTSIAQDAGLLLGNDGGIAVDDYFYTSDPAIMACGDCTSKRDHTSGKEAGIRLASTAAMEGIIAGLNVEKKNVPHNKGVINNFTTKIGNTVFGATGVTEKDALENNYDVVTLKNNFPNRHPTKLPGAEEISVKLIFNKPDARILGGQVKGSECAAELVNVIGTAVQNNLTAIQLASSQYATHPLLTTGPTGYPLLKLSVEACSTLGRI